MSMSNQWLNPLPPPFLLNLAVSQRMNQPEVNLQNNDYGTPSTYLPTPQNLMQSAQGKRPQQPLPWMVPFSQSIHPPVSNSPKPFQDDVFLKNPPQKMPSLSTLSPAQIAAPAAIQPVAWQNKLKSLFHKNQAIIYALNLRTFGAFDYNADGRISYRLGESGTFLSSIKRLDELASAGVNTIHLLPIQPPGKIKQFGEAGSVYAPEDYHQLNPQFDTQGNNLDVWQEAQIFVNEAHKRGINVMIDVPSCASIDLAQKRPDLIARDAQGRTLTPTNWVDIVMFKNSPALVEYYEKFFDLMVNKLGVDGFRVDVARARTQDFWKHFIGKYPDKAWLAETYVEEDASPLRNIPRDTPEDLLKVGFDSIYGQFHIFHSMANAKEYTDYLVKNREMLKRAGQNKSFIGSFLTHDDPSLMEKGGVLMSLLASGLMTTQPWTNPYILDGFLTGYDHHFDIFNYRPRPTGNHPEIGQFFAQMMKLRQQYEPILSQGQFIPIPVTGEPNNQVIAFARQMNGKTLLVVANKDINARHSATLNIPGLIANHPLQNLAPKYGRPSHFRAVANQLKADLGAGRFHVFEINTPQLATQLPAY